MDTDHVVIEVRSPVELNDLSPGLPAEPLADRTREIGAAVRTLIADLVQPQEGEVSVPVGCAAEIELSVSLEFIAGRGVAVLPEGRGTIGLTITLKKVGA